MTAGNRRISSLAVPVVASLDPSSKDNMKQWVNLMGRSAEEIQAILGAYSTKTAKSLKDPLDNFALHVDKVINKAAASAARTGFVPEASMQQLRVAVELSNLLGDSFLRWKAAETLNIAESLRLPEALNLAKQLNSELAHVREAAASGLAGQARMQNEAASYDSAVFDWADRQEAQRRAGAAGRRLDNQENVGPTGLSPAAAAMQREEAQRRAAEAGRRLDDRDSHNPVGMSPAAMAAFADEARKHQLATAQRLDQYGTPTAPVQLSPATLAAYEAEARQHGSGARARLDQYGVPTPEVALSPAAAAARQERSDDAWRNARADHMNESPGELQRSRIFEHARRQEEEANNRRVRQDIDHANAMRMARRQDQRIPGIIANEADRDDGPGMMADDGDIDEEATGGRVLHHRSIDGRKRKGVRGRGWFGVLTKGGSHSVRFAAQNVGFGIDDAIQSYQYGGAGASIRAASNNATAIAGMLISNPVIAAGAVVAISIASAALPILLRRFGLDKPFGDLTATERFNSQVHENWFGGHSMNANWQKDKETSEQTWVAGQKARLIGLGNDTEGDWLKGALQQGGFVSFISGMANKQVQGGNKLGQNAAERKLLEAENIDLQMRSNGGWDATATKELERNLSRMEELEKEDRVLNAERRQNAGVIANARNMLPKNLKRMSEMSSYDRETEMMFGRGDLDGASLDRRLEARAEMERKSIRANSTFNGEQQRAELLRVDMELMQKKMDPDRERLLALAVHDASVGRRRFDASQSPQNNYTQARQSFSDQHSNLTRQWLDSSMSADEMNRRRDLLSRRSNVTLQRAFEDDIDNLNPERNPLKRLNSRTRRTTEDIEAMDLPADKKRELLLAHLKGAERDAKEAMIPSGTRKYISQGYKIGSLEDEELRARMVGNFGPPEKKENHDSKTFEEIRDALHALNAKLDFQAAKLGV